MRNLWLILSLALGFAGLGPAQGQSPVQVPYGQFGNPDRNSAGQPNNLQMTADEEAQFLAALRAIDFPAYFYSGCNDRAHAAYLMLPASLRPKVMKIWLATPTAYSPILRGAIGLAQPAADAPPVAWNYHIALAVRGPNGLRIYDAGLFPGRLLDRETWLAAMNIPPLTIEVLTHGRVYMLSQQNADTYSLNSKVWNGTFYTYNGSYDTEQWIERALARDEIGDLAMRGDTCDYLRQLVARPDDMQTFLRGFEPGSDPPVAANADNVRACRESIDRYNAAQRRWAERIPEQSWD